MRKSIAFSLFPLLLIPILLAGQETPTEPPPANEPTIEPDAAAEVAEAAADAVAGAESSAEPAADPQTAAIAEAARAFDEAYNAKDAAALAGLFTESAELVDSEGVVRGREAIQERFAAIFEQRPGATVETQVISARFPAPDLAIEEGITYLFVDPDSDAVEYRYVAVHIRRDGVWKAASVRAEPVALMPAPGQMLDSLSWLVGEWVDEGDESAVWTSCRWSDDGNWLIQEYEVEFAEGPPLRGTQRIGWDPIRQQIRSWAFDSTGGVIEGVWAPDGDRWIVDVKGHTGEGVNGSAIRIVTPVGTDAFEIKSLHRMTAGVPLPDSFVRVVRAPPRAEAQVQAEIEGDAGVDADALEVPVEN